MGSLSLLQGLFPTQGSYPGLLQCRQILLPAEPHQLFFKVDKSRFLVGISISTKNE